MELNVLDLFSGIGGFSVGLEATGKFKTIGFCEQDKFCQKVLRKHWNDVPIYEDIKKLDAKKIKADVVVGGFPCQSFSIAGKQKGKDDERYLWDEMFRIIKEVKPKWIIGENVQNLTNISNGEILQGIYNDLESQSYEVQTFNISASSQGAWHKRSRIWIIAANTQCLGFSKGSKESKKFKGEETSNKFIDCNKRSQFRETSNQMEFSNPNSGFSFKQNKKIFSRGTPIKSSSSSHDTNSKSIRSQGYELQHNLENGQELTEQLCQTNIKKQQTWWEIESKLFGVPNGISTELDTDRANRIKALGNSIVPQIVTEIGKAMIAAEKEMNGI